ncbi:MAG: DNA polymerase III subunit beta [Chitinophagales bacterium]|jgi:DNA polymerase-3 subunit beta|nr:DNA polymerase III subunit beta [Sphingobacteriales bacterium]MBP6665376.1 DNA polymerase III subunit beta [Chitinophagales bacterium]MBP7533938.1 DNA polymerase III subunit beta [Chitinophagales bacterium]
MQFTVSSSALLKQLQNVGGAIGNNSTLPILGDFLFSIDGSTLTISATDLETSMSASIVVNADRDGSIAVPAKIMLDMLKALPEQPLLFRVNEDSFAIEIQTLNGQYKLSGEDGNDFPRIPEATNNDNSISIPAYALTNAINKTIFAVSHDELRPAMTGVFFEIADNQINFVATDAHRLVKYTLSDIENTGDAASFIVPKKALNLLKSALPSTEILVSVSYDRSNAFFSFGDIHLVCRLIDARFPDYNAVIPKNNDKKLAINRNEFQNSLRRISIFSNRTTYQVVLRMTEEQLTLTAQDIDYSNEASEKIPCEYSGEPMDIGFNARLLIEMVNSFNNDDITIEFSTPGRAAVMLPSETTPNEEIFTLIMPIMLN